MDVFIDTDAGWDDWCAISLLARSSNNINIKGIVVNGCGESYQDTTTISDIDDKFGGLKNTLNLLKLAGGLDETVPVYVGNNIPLSYYNVFPHSFKKSVTELLNVSVSLPQSSVQPSSVTASDGLANALQESPDLQYLSIGGLSGLATYFKNKPEAPVPKTVVVMGGAYTTGNGNLGPLFPEAYLFNKDAEWNLFVDPMAAKDAFAYLTKQGSEVTMVTLEATQQVPLTKEFVDSIDTTEGTVAEFIHAVLSKRYDQAQAGGYTEFFYDPLAAMLLVVGTKLGNKTPGTLDVVADLDETQSEVNYSLGRLDFIPAEKSEQNRLDLADGGAEVFYDNFRRLINLGG